MSFQVETLAFPPPDGPLRYAPIPWDSETFGFPFYELRCGEASEEAIAQHLPALLREIRGAGGRRLVYGKLPVAEVAKGRGLCAAGFYPVETMFELHLSLARFKPLTAGRKDSFVLRPATMNDLPALERLAAGAFHADRLHTDPNLPADKADERFRKWIVNGLKAGERVFAYEQSRDKKIVGFYHVRELEAGVVDLSLAAIEAALQNIGIGALMYEAVLLDCRARGDKLATTHITANNLNVLNLFSRLGFGFRNPTITFHWMAK